MEYDELAHNDTTLYIYGVNDKFAGWLASKTVPSEKREESMDARQTHIREISNIKIDEVRIDSSTIIY